MGVFLALRDPLLSLGTPPALVTPPPGGPTSPPPAQEFPPLRLLTTASVFFHSTSTSECVVFITPGLCFQGTTLLLGAWDKLTPDSE